MADYDNDYDNGDYFDLDDEEDNYGLDTLWDDDYDGYGNSYDADDNYNEDYSEPYAESYDDTYNNDTYNNNTYNNDTYNNDEYTGYDSQYHNQSWENVTYRQHEYNRVYDPLQGTGYHSPEKSAPHIYSIREDHYIYLDNGTMQAHDVNPQHNYNDRRYSYGRGRYYSQYSPDSPDYDPMSYPRPPPMLNNPPSAPLQPMAQPRGFYPQDHPQNNADTLLPPYGRRRSRSHDGYISVPPASTGFPDPSQFVSSYSNPVPTLSSIGAVPAASENFQGDGGPGLAVPAGRRDSSIRRSKSLTKPLSSMAKGALSAPQRTMSKLASGFRGRTLTRHGFRDKSRSRSGPRS